MEILKKIFKEKPRNLWKDVSYDQYQYHVTISSVDSPGNSEQNNEIDEKVVYMEDLKKRTDAYGICGECNEPGTGEYWCQPCNAERFKKIFKNWTSGNYEVDELIQHSQLNAVYYKKYLEWIPFENFQNVTYVAIGGFGKIYSAYWPKGPIYYWNIKKQEWHRFTNIKVALKSLDNSSDTSTDFLNEIKSHLQIYAYDTIPQYGITQDPNTKDYMIVLEYCEGGNLKNQFNKNLKFKLKVNYLSQIARGLLDIHNAEKVHGDLNSGKILFDRFLYISDLGLCQPNNEKQSKVFGVFPYVAPEVLCGKPYTKAADIYSFGIIMNEFMSEGTPYNNIAHDISLALDIVNKGLRPETSDKDIPKFLLDLIEKCWDANAKNRPTAKKLYQILNKWNYEINNNNSEIYSQIKEYEKIRENKLKISLSENEFKNT